VAEESGDKFGLEMLESADGVYEFLAMGCHEWAASVDELHMLNVLLNDFVKIQIRDVPRQAFQTKAEAIWYCFPQFCISSQAR